MARRRRPRASDSQGHRSATNELIRRFVYDRLHTAIVAERLHRGLPALQTFHVPPAWSTTYPPLAAKTPHCTDLRETAAAVGLVAMFLEPAMTGAALAHAWIPSDRVWIPSDRVWAAHSV